MKKKVITILIIICVVIAIISLAIILLNGGKEESGTIPEENNLSTEQIEQTEETKKEEVKKENILLDSKIGSEITSKILVPNIYSKLIYDELDKNGLSNDFKIMYTYSLITSYNEYSSYLREGEDYLGNYITADDLEKVAKETFDKVDNLEHKAIFGEKESYNMQQENYVIVARGYAGNDLNYIVEIPYEIFEYNDKIELNSYRLYITRSYDLEGENALPEDTIYYDKANQNKAIMVSDEKILDENGGQKEYLMKLIDEGQIDKTKIDTTTWTLTKLNSNYLLSDFKVND